MVILGGEHFEKMGDEMHLTSEGIEVFSRAMRERIMSNWIRIAILFCTWQISKSSL